MRVEKKSTRLTSAPVWTILRVRRSSACRKRFSGSFSGEFGPLIVSSLIIVRCFYRRRRLLAVLFSVRVQTGVDPSRWSQAILSWRNNNAAQQQAGRRLLAVLFSVRVQTGVDRSRWSRAILSWRNNNAAQQQAGRRLLAVLFSVRVQTGVDRSRWSRAILSWRNNNADQLQAGRRRRNMEHLKKVFSKKAFPQETRKTFFSRELRLPSCSAEQNKISRSR